MRPSGLTLIALVGAVAVLAAACSGSDTTPTPAPATAEPTAVPSAATTRVEVTLSDALTIEPAAMTVPAGEPVTFAVTNAGTTLHEFVLGDEEAQAEHEAEMAEMGGMGQDEEMAISVEPGQTKELTVTFPGPGVTLAGCHVAGHYAGGMKAQVTIE
jgi:uncharacterized cupredoxin-like copper-binding protein